VRPAINVGISVSRVGGNAQVKPMRRVAGRLKLELSQYRELEAFAQFGSDLDPATQRTLARGERLVAALNQNERSPLPVAEQTAVVFAGTNGYLDRITVGRIPEFLDGLGQRLRSEKPELLEQIAGGAWEDSTQEELDAAIKEFADDFGYDLDEDGNPLEDAGDSERVTRRSSSDEEAEEAEASEEEKEPARA
jgi:F-type H+-transporting ATPase subunit alpha